MSATLLWADGDDLSVLHNQQDFNFTIPGGVGALVYGIRRKSGSRTSAWVKLTNASDGLIVSFGLDAIFATYWDATHTPQTISAVIPHRYVNVWTFIEVAFVFAGIAGTQEIHIAIQGNTLISAVGLDASRGGWSLTESIGSVFFDGGTEGNHAYFARINSAPPSFFGDLRPFPIAPDAAGSSAMFTPTGAATNHEACVSNNGDTSYVEGAALNDLDLYNYTALSTQISAGLNVKALASHVVSKQVGVTGGPGTDPIDMSTAIKSGATIDLQNDGVPGVGYTDKTRLYLTNPDTGLPWTIADVDAVEHGMKITALV